MEMNQAGYVTETDFGEVRWRLEHSRTVGMGLLFTGSREMLLDVARLLSESGTRSLGARQRRLQFLFERGLVKLPAELSHDESPFTVDLASLGDGFACQVIFLPQVYLVYVPCLSRFPVPPAFAWPVGLSLLK